MGSFEPRKPLIEDIGVLRRQGNQILYQESRKIPAIRGVVIAGVEEILL